MSDPVEPLLAHFAVRDLPPRLAEIARPFGELAHEIVRSLPRHPERTVALRKVLEGMDAALRAARYYAEPEEGR